MVFFALLNNETGIRAEIILTPGPDSYEVIQEALILAEPNSEIFLSEGVYEFEDGLSLDVDLQEQNTFLVEIFFVGRSI